MGLIRFIFNIIIYFIMTFVPLFLLFQTSSELCQAFFMCQRCEVIKPEEYIIQNFQKYL